MNRSRAEYWRADTAMTLINPIISSAVLSSALHTHLAAVAIRRIVMLKFDRGLA
jgi:hypothetical protein